MHKHITVVGLVALISILLLSAPLYAQEPDSALFEDDFSSDMGWIDESDGAIFRDDEAEVLVWQTDNEAAQRYAIPLEADAEAVQLDYRVNVTEAGASGGIFIGLAESLSGAMDNADAPTGMFVALNHTAEGTTLAYPWITYADQAAQMAVDMDDATTYIDLGEMGAWLDVQLVIEAGMWTLAVTDENGDDVGTITGDMSAQHTAYTHVILFYEGADWDMLSGQLDDLVVTAGSPAEAASETPAVSEVEPCIISTDEPYVAVRLGPGLNRGERFSLPVGETFTVTGWDETSDGLLWWQINMPDTGDDRTWVQQDQVTTSGDCDTDSIAASSSAIVAAAPGAAPGAASGASDSTGSDSAAADSTGGETTSSGGESASSGDAGGEPGDDTPITATSVQLGIGRGGDCIAVEGRWAAIWNQNQHLGCPVNQSHVENADFQSFLSGRVIHRKATGEIIILYSSGAYAIYLDTWAGETVPCTLPNSWGSLAYLWCIDPNVQQWLGVTTGGLGSALSFTVQDFQSGMIFWSDQTGNVILYPNYTWAGF